MGQQLQKLQYLPTLEEREEEVREMMLQCCRPQDTLCFRADDSGVDYFLVRFDNPEDAHRARVEIGFSPLENSNLSALSIPIKLPH